ncbi:MAG: Asp23/Gls24 family envelope stress response protein [Candidatus Omnitrophica bacterium]|nr:Asp23/Gls24 family envelope stress response protein [Candidatus Omnitrophota bacterium]
MQQDNSRTDLGLIRIHKNAIASVSSLASLEIEGVKRLGTNLKSRILELMGKPSSSAIKIEINKSDEVKVEIPLFIKYGYNIPEVASKVQENVRQALERMTNLSVKDIDVNVQGIERGTI